MGAHCFLGAISILLGLFFKPKFSFLHPVSTQLGVKMGAKKFLIFFLITRS